jgi:hypothetical protein
MKTFQLLTLARMYIDRFEQFSKAHPHDWLLWEPGEWNPVSPDGTLVVKAAGSTNPNLGGGLAIALEPNPDGQVSVGREPPCDVVIHDGTLSKWHLTFKRATTGWTVADAAKRQSSWCNGKPIDRPLKLESGARLQAGKVFLTFYAPAGLFERLKG